MYPTLLSGRKESYQSAVLDLFAGNFVGYWPMDDSPKSQNFIRSQSYSAGKIDCGTDATVNNLIDAGASDFYIDLYVRFDTTPAVNVLASKDNNSDAGWRISINNTPVLGFSSWGASTNVGSSISWTHDGEFHHIVFAFQASDKKVYIATDGGWAGSYTGQTALVGTVGDDSAIALTLLRLATISSQSLTSGDMGWFRISDTLRETIGVDFTPPDRLTPPDVDANTVLLLRMDEGYGATAYDVSGNANHGTISSCDWGSYPALRDISGNGNHGTYQGVSLYQEPGPGMLSKNKYPYLDGVTDLCNLYSAGFLNKFNGAECTIIATAKAESSASWSDGIERRLFVAYADINNYFILRQNDGSTGIKLDTKGGASSNPIQKDNISTAEWFQVGVTRSETNDEVIGYWNGATIGAPNTGLSNFSGNPISTNTVAFVGGTTLNGVWLGWGGELIVLNKIATGAQMAYLAKLAGVA